MRTFLDDLLARGYVLLVLALAVVYAVCVYAPVRVVRWLRDRTWP